MGSDMCLGSVLFWRRCDNSGCSWRGGVLERWNSLSAMQGENATNSALI